MRSEGSGAARLTYQKFSRPRAPLSAHFPLPASYASDPSGLFHEEPQRFRALRSTWEVEKKSRDGGGIFFEHDLEPSGPDLFARVRFEEAGQSGSRLGEREHDTAVIGDDSSAHWHPRGFATTFELQAYRAPVDCARK